MKIFVYCKAKNNVTVCVVANKSVALSVAGHKTTPMLYFQTLLMT